jgi:hypothetical protein
MTGHTEQFTHLTGRHPNPIELYRVVSKTSQRVEKIAVQPSVVQNKTKRPKTQAKTLQNQGFRLLNIGQKTARRSCSTSWDVFEKILLRSV